MKNNNFTENVLNMNCLINYPQLSDFDFQIAEQYMPAINEHYVQSLAGNQKSLEYLAQNYCINDELITQNGLGFSCREIGNHLPHPKSNEGRMIRGSLRRLRLLKPYGHKDISTTQVYLHVTQVQLKKTYDKTHPAVTQGKHSVTKQVNGYLN